MKYPISMENIARNLELNQSCGGVFEENIPLVKYSSDFYYNPATICQYAIDLWELTKSNNETIKDTEIKFLKQVEWLKNNYEEINNTITWKYKIPYIPYKIEPGWCSALAQGNAISVLLRAYLDGDNEALELAKTAYELFDIPVLKGGVKSFTPEEIWWLEEYPCFPYSHVLNGFIFALFSIWELWQITNDIRYLKDWEKGINSLKKSTKHYDSKYWCYYHRYPENISFISPYYMQNIYMPQYNALYSITNDDFFLEYYKKWQYYLNSKRCHYQYRLVRYLNRVSRRIKRL